MNAADTIAAAIEKLEALTAASGYQEVNGWLTESPSKIPITSNLLFVTLHRTMDAQLAILQDAARAWADPLPMAMFGGGDMRDGIYSYQLDLARAILGVSDD